MNGSDSALGSDLDSCFLALQMRAQAGELLGLQRQGHVLRLADADPFVFLSFGVTNPIGRLGGMAQVAS